MRLLHIAVQGFQIEAELAKVLRFKSANLQFDRNKCVQTAVEKEQIECEVAAADLKRIF